MKRTIGVVLAVSALLLGGCSEDSATETSTSETPTTQSTAAEQGFAKVGDTIPVGCQSGQCTGELKVEEILLGQDCKVPLLADEVPEGMQLAQLSGIVTATEKVVDTDGSEIGVRPEGPVAWDSEKFKTTGEWGGGCDIPQGYEQWAVTPAKMDEKVRTYGAFLIPADAQTLGIADSKFDLREASSATKSTTSSAATSSQAAPPQSADGAAPSSAAKQGSAAQQNAPAEQAPAVAPAPAPAQQDAGPVVGYTEAPGQVQPHPLDKQIASCGAPSIHQLGTTFFTDGTSGWTQDCAAQMS